MVAIGLRDLTLSHEYGAKVEATRINIGNRCLAVTVEYGIAPSNGVGILIT